MYGEDVEISLNVHFHVHKFKEIFFSISVLDNWNQTGVFDDKLAKHTLEPIYTVIQHLYFNTQINSSV